ncbi:carboxylate-amine ligase [Tistlia consotensis]|uniref:Putative glutamate--cysteine ligase 2 n=1 Tax=Tistlia consotensis USBA 355 TaxID=560819 RepID=A0A1Y6CAR9_9PROT|nr:carboxylate-amine ligase [Tistlia consotensis]SMF45858.1 carboxylate-amine ligase [Tistlia consotensis USBA 355]SNR79161.1 carboxylate-amine ligase [Tistlia consotensis]
MTRAEPPFTIGIEEEYLLVDRQSRELVVDPPDSLLSRCEAELEGHVSPEFLQSQIEVGTSKCDGLGQACGEIRSFRRGVARVAREYGLAPIAASTHPFASWDLQKHTDKERYNVLARDIQAPARRLVICGMHVHVGLDDDDLRIDLLSQVAYFLPHLLALSTSSPFWRGQDSGLKSYRLAVFDELPRTGLPEHFDSWGEYQRHIRVLVDAGLFEDASKLWWDVRPSARFPTLELRIPDVCTTVRDGFAVAAIYLCLLRMLWRLKRDNQRWRRYSNLLVNENRWRAQRYGFDSGLVDFGRGEIVPYPELLEEIVALTATDAEHFGCRAEIEWAREIVRRGTSAHRQLAAYRAARDAGAAPREALNAVVDFLIEETVAGLDEPTDI